MLDQKPALRAWQADCLADERPKLLVQASPRTGKTRVGVEWVLAGGEGRALVLAPLGVCRVWEAELPGAVPLYEMPVKALRGALERVRATPGAVALLNYDKLARALPWLLTAKFDRLVGDEIHLIRHSSSARSRAFRKLAAAVPRNRLFTGTLVAKSLADLWAPMSCVDAGLWGSSYSKFERNHLIVDAMQYGQVLGARRPDDLQVMVERCSRSYRREDVFGPDTWQTVDRTYDLGPVGRRLYDAAVKAWVLDLERDGVELDLSHTLSRMTRLAQLTAGVLPEGIPVDPGTVLETPRLDAALADLEEILAAGEKAVVFYRFRGEGRAAVEAIRGLGKPVFEIHGGVGPEERVAALQGLERAKDGAVMVAQSSAGGVGVSMATATHALFLSQSFSFVTEEQARDRIYAPGQVRVVTTYRARRTIDEYIAATLALRGRVHAAVSRNQILAVAYADSEHVKRNGAF